MKNYLKIVAVLLATSITTMAFAEDQKCPALTASDVQAIIDSPDVVPDKQFGTEFYYVFGLNKNVDNKTYLIGVGEILGKDIPEARERAKKILSTGEESFEGMYFSQAKLCLYNKVWDASIVPGYPVGAEKTVILFAKPYDGETLQLQNLFMKK